MVFKINIYYILIKEDPGFGLSQCPQNYSLKPTSLFLVVTWPFPNSQQPKLHVQLKETPVGAGWTQRNATYYTQLSS